ncbi:hypothetical protein LSH36_127g10011 [Paralvinella palmiformis]|uniref:Uncharacterized protein n=1 Tax=Paralvinella palmiformis TaxID=53620 RepID=A0AAD9JXC4_9ANNE|nr:hypothetical protein LSH36_127g10011 [Paralvinella palmiformis]
MEDRNAFQQMILVRTQKVAPPLSEYLYILSYFADILIVGQATIGTRGSRDNIVIDASCISSKSIGIESSLVRGFQNPDFQSDWLLVKSQSPTNRIKLVEHHLGEVPIKVKVMIKPEEGPYENWIFEAGSSQQAGDDLPWLYCGILYNYDVTHVVLYAPRIGDYNMTTGRAFCIDSHSWTFGTNSADMDQVGDSVLAKVMAWRSSTFPATDFDTDWQNISVLDPPNLIEIAHAIVADISLVHLQIRCADLNTENMTYAEGIGRAFLLGFGDGYDTDTSGCEEGEFRVRVWKSLGHQPEQFNFKLNGLGEDSIPDMSALKVNVRTWDPMDSYINVQVKALDGPNKDFVFSAIGQIHRNAYPGTTYGGVAFAYSADKIRIFVPANETGSIIHVPDNWGTDEYIQTSNNVEITVKIWSTNFASLCSFQRSTIGRFQKLPGYGIPDEWWIRCVMTCLSKPDCIGTIPSTYQCTFLDLNALNSRIVEDTLDTEQTGILDKFRCT